MSEFTKPDSKMHKHSEQKITDPTDIAEGQVVGSVFLTDYDGPIKEFPRNVTVKGVAEMRDCKAFRECPSGLTVSGDFGASDNYTWTSLARDLKVGRSLDIWHCKSIQTIPSSIVVGKDLHAYGCTALVEIESGFQSNGSIGLQQCTSLKIIPDDFVVKGNLTLGGCISLEGLPRGLNVMGDLDLRYCTALVSLPEDLEVTGSINLSGCEGIKIPRTILDRYGDRIYFPENYRVTEPQAGGPEPG